MSNEGNPKCDYDLAERIYDGQHYEVWRGTFEGRAVCVKSTQREPIPAADRHVYGASWSTSFSRVVSVIAKSGVEVEGAPLEDLLHAEASRIRASAGAWNHEVLAVDEDALVGTCLVTPLHPGCSLDHLDRDTARRLLPALLPRLWDALAAAPHGDVSASNLIVDPVTEEFALIDPCTSTVHAYRRCEEDIILLVYTTTPACYPLLPPWYQSGLSLAEGHTLSEYLEDFLYGMAMSSRPQAVGDVTTMTHVAVRRPRVGHKIIANEPHPADLMALGVLYDEVLTGGHPFFDGDYPRPGWLGGRVEDLHRIGFDDALRKAAQAPPSPRARATDVTEAEARLALALVTLAVPSRGALARLAEAAVASI